LVGTGVVGGELFRQLEATKDILLKQHKLDVKIAAVSSLKDGKSWQILADKGLTIAQYEAALKDPSKGEPSDSAKLGAFLKSLDSHAVVFDCTASEQVIAQCGPTLTYKFNYNLA
jgi:homoserine dehydrogenase